MRLRCEAKPKAEASIHVMADYNSTETVNSTGWTKALHIRKNGRSAPSARTRLSPAPWAWP